MVEKFRGDPKTMDEVRQTLARIYKLIGGGIGNMASQDSNAVAISGGTIAGANVNMTGKTLTLDAKQIDVAKVGTSETATTKFLKPDGAGGVEFGTVPSGGGGSTWNTFLALIGAGGI